MQEYCVYMLRCSDHSFYVGVTSALSDRLVKHREGWDTKCYTFMRRPLECVLVERYSEIRFAIAREKQLKRWSRKKKEALIAGDDNALHAYAECKNETHHSLKENSIVSPRAEPRGDTD